MRGADDLHHAALAAELETSPHAWSRLRQHSGLKVGIGNISTCVEQTVKWTRSFSQRWKHLHMRGADQLNNASHHKEAETSPHAWSRQRHLVVQLFI